MSTCEKCWSDAHINPRASVAAEYRRLLKYRDENDLPCSAEDQAGPEATKCLACGKVTCHQWTGECMGCHLWWRLTRGTPVEAGRRHT